MEDCIAFFSVSFFNTAWWPTTSDGALVLLEGRLDADCADSRSNRAAAADTRPVPGAYVDALELFGTGACTAGLLRLDVAVEEGLLVNTVAAGAGSCGKASAGAGLPSSLAMLVFVRRRSCLKGRILVVAFQSPLNCVLLF